MNNKPNGDFFVGYLPTPGKLRMFYWITVPVLLASLLGTGTYIASSQQSAGKGQWLVPETRTTQGFLSVDPYPVLHTTGSNPKSILLVRPGKSSAHDLVAPHAGKSVAITGVPIDRGGWSMMEVRTPEDIREQPAMQGSALPEPQVFEAVSLTGQIVDSKCFLGVMKPGAGKVHRACAAMCLTGGMPPMLVVTNSDGDRYGYMLINNDGSSASKNLIPFVDVPVRISGQLERRGDLTYLRMGDAQVERVLDRAS